MAVEAHKSEPLIKSAPAMERLNSFSGHTVTVTKHTAPRNTTGQMVVPTQQMKLNQILELQSSIPLSYGPGFYRFEVVDTGGQGSDAWMVKLGPDVQQEGFTMAGPGVPFAPPNGVSAAPVGEGVVHLGHQFYYNEALGTLTTPWKAVYNWRQGDPIPVAPTTNNQNQFGHLQFPPPNQWQQSTPFSWGGYPASDTGESSKIKALEAQIAEDRRSREAEQQRLETRRLMEEMQRRTDEQIARMMTLFEKAFSTPKGPSDEMIAIRAELAETKRASEMRDREDRLRTEMRDNQARFETALRELSANKADPMLPMLMQMMQTSQASAAKAVEAIQATTTAASTAAERSTQQMLAQVASTIISPVTLMQMMESANSRGSEGSKMVVESLRESMTMQREVFTQLLDVSSQGAQPPWVPLVQEALQRIGMVGEQLAKRQAQQQPPPPPMVRQPPQAQAMAGAPVRPQVAPPSTPVPPQNGAGAPQNVVPIKPAAVTPPQSAPAPAKRRRKRLRGNQAEPPADPRGYSIEEMRSMDPKDVWEATKNIADEQFFGEIYPYVRQIREQVKTSMPAAGAAEMLLRNRGYVQSMGVMPPAAELLFAEQIQVLIARLLPEAPDAYKHEVISVIEQTLIEEAEGPGDDDEDDETEEDVQP